ncbi:hypothetical protein HDV04_000256 [Boothiomyces sp. JEL0838]|nr:hypothetical protein HDV04_000256 [Boothiomyces sp. JEL0838]
MEQFMLLNTGLPFDVGASIAVPILTTINQNKVDEKTWKGIYSRCCLLLGRFFNDDILLNTSRVCKITAVNSNEAETFINDILKSLFVGIFDDSSLTCHIYDCFILYSKESLNDATMPSIGDWILWSTCCITEIEKGDGHYSKLSEMSKADFTTLMEDNYLQDFRNLKLQKLNVAEQDVSSADESEYIKPPQYTHRLKVWNKAKQNQKNIALSKWRRKVKQVIVWLKYLEELKQLAFATKMRSMHKQTVEDQDKDKKETRPVEKPKKTNPFVE